MLTVAEAEARILARATLRPVVRVPTEAAVGRVLREEIRTDRDLPPFDRSTMDGIAIAYAPGRESFHIEGIQAAGQPAKRLADPEKGCLEIMTGAMCPDGADTVVPYEDIAIAEGRATLKAKVERGQFLHRRGADRKAGEVLLPAGVRLRSPQIAIALSAGRTSLVVAKPPRFAVISVGDELIESGRPLEPYQIHPSNAWGIRAALQGLGCPEVELARLPDDPSRIERAIADLLARCDGLILSGGVSRGKFDFVPAALERLGVVLDFHRIAQKPGKPMWFGLAPGGKPVFALPGNPVSTLVCFHRYVKPFLLQSLGAAQAMPETISVQGPVHPHPELTLFLPVRIMPQGALVQAYHGSGDYAALGESDGFIEVSPDGAAIRYHRWDV